MLHRVNTQTASGMVSTLEISSASATILVHSHPVNVRIPVGPNTASSINIKSGSDHPFTVGPAPHNLIRDYTGKKPSRRNNGALSR